MHKTTDGSSSDEKKKKRRTRTIIRSIWANHEWKRRNIEKCKRFTVQKAVVFLMLLLLLCWPFHLIYTFQPNNQPFLLAILFSLFYFAQKYYRIANDLPIFYTEKYGQANYDIHFSTNFLHTAKLNPFETTFLCICKRYSTVFTQNFYFSFDLVSCDFFFFWILWAEKNRNVASLKNYKS